MKTFLVKKKDVIKNWYIVDATKKTLGRFSTKIAHYLRGKHKPEYSPHMDCGDYIIVINAEKIEVTGDKKKKKIYYHHTGYIGGIKQKNFEDMIKNCPTKIIRLAVKGMLPKNILGRAMYRKLKVYKGNTNKHIAQKPIFLNI